MAGADVKVSVQSGVLSTSGSGTTDFTEADLGTPKAWIVLVGFDETDDTTVQDQSRMSIGFGDGTSNFCISHQDDHASAKVDCDSIKSNTKSFIIMEDGATTIIDGTSAATTDGVQLTNTTNTDGDAPFVTVIMFGGADLNISLQSTTIGSSVGNTATVDHASDGFTDGNDKLVFFIGVDLSGEDSAGTGINNSYGVCHISGPSGSETIVQRSIGWASDHNATEGAPSFEITTDRVLNIIAEDGTADWGLEVTSIESDGDIIVTTRDTGAGSAMEVYSLALDLGSSKAKVDSVNSPTTTTFAISGMGFKPQYVGMMLTDVDTESTARDAVQTALNEAGVAGISSNAGSGSEICHSWYNTEATPTTDTATLFRSRVIDLRTHVTGGVIQDHSHSSFDSGGVTHTVNTENEDVAKKWAFWAIETNIKDSETTGNLSDVIMGIQNTYAGPFEID